MQPFCLPSTCPQLLLTRAIKLPSQHHTTQSQTEILCALLLYIHDPFLLGTTGLRQSDAIPTCLLFCQNLTLTFRRPPFRNWCTSYRMSLTRCTLLNMPYLNLFVQIWRNNCSICNRFTKSIWKLLHVYGDKILKMNILY